MNFAELRTNRAPDILCGILLALCLLFVNRLEVAAQQFQRITFRVDLRARANAEAAHRGGGRAPALEAVHKEIGKSTTTEERPFPAAAQKTQYDAAEREARDIRGQQPIEIPF